MNLVDDSKRQKVLQWIQFHSHPISYAHPSWIEALEHRDLITKLKGHSRAHPHLSRHLLSENKADGPYEFSEEAPYMEIAMKTSDEIMHLVEQLGLIVNHRHIRGVVHRDKQKQLRLELGDEAFFFAIKEAPFLTNKVCDAVCPDYDWSELNNIKSHIINSGLQVLRSVFAEAPEEVVKRVGFKIPQPLHKDFSLTAAVSPDWVLSIIGKLKKRGAKWQCSIA